MNVRDALERRVGEAIRQAGGLADAPALVAISARPEFGDYQANGVMGAAKRAKTNPRKLAEKVIECLDLSDLAESVEIAGPGFLNIRLRDEWISERLAEGVGDERLGADRSAAPQTVVVDYSHPNLAKEMHVGHLRSTIIGDAIVRTLEFLGHRVIRHNHVGDWGTQFGMLLAHMDSLAEQGEDRLSGELADLEAFYVASKRRFDAEPDFADRAREYVVKLQGGDAHCLEMWGRFIDESLKHCERVYAHLGVTLKREDVRPESAYNDDLPCVVEDLRALGLLTESEGAQCVFLDEFRGKDDEPLPAIIQKSDGGYLYATTDLAAVRYRANTLSADRILYVVDARQSLHLRQVFAIARKAGFAPDSCSLEHHAFGMMMGDDGKPFKTRDGGTVKLVNLLDEAERRAFELVTAKNPDLSEEQRVQIARTVGIGAVKYADLAQNRTSDYVFSWSKMLSLEGNTAPYMQYAYARVCSIFRKAGLEQTDADGAITLTEPAERALGLKLAQFPETIENVVAECLPNTLCTYLFSLAGVFMGFYESCPVLQAPDEATRSSRLSLCHLTARTIRCGLGLLGIETIDQM
jgi:arginyl-tRNA synthetase